MARIKYYDSVTQQWVYGDMAVCLPSSRLPAKYQEVEYIGSTGTQNLELGLHTNGNMSASLDCEITARVATWAVFFGAWQDNKHFGATATDTDNQIQIIHGSTTQYLSFAFNTRQKIYITPSFAVWNDAYKTYTPTNFVSTTSMALFAGTALKCYRCIIKEADICVLDLVPCYRISDSEIGMYDTVNGVFYTNAGSGTFTKGADV